MGRAVSAYVRGVATVALVDAMLIGLVLVVLGVPLAVPLIVLTFLAAFFPIIGAVLAGVAAVLVALVANGVGDRASSSAAAIIAVQQIEGNVLYPLVVGRRLSLHPVAVLLALTAGGMLGGVAGAFLAVPVAAVGAAMLEFSREHRRASTPVVLPDRAVAAELVARLPPAVRTERPGTRGPSPKRAGSGAPPRSVAASRSAIAGPCLKPWPEPPPSSHTDGCSGWRAAMKWPSGVSS